MSKKIGVGVLGAGRIGSLHARNLKYALPDVAELVGIAEVRGAGAIGFADGWNVLLTDDPDEIINHPKVDAVLICTSTDTHAELLMKSAAAQKHVFCEKPVDTDAGRIIAAVKAADDAGIKLQIGFNRRFDHNFKAIRDMARAGRVGDVHLVRITSRDPAPPSAEYAARSGGMFIDMTIHDFDMARYLAGSEVTEVYAAAAVLVDPAIGKAGDIDTAVITLKFANGAIGVIDNSRRAAYGYDQRAEVFGSLGSAQSHNDAAHTVVLSGADGVVAEKPKYFFLERYQDSFVEELRAFFAAIANDTEPPVTGRDGLMPVLIAQAAQQSRLTGMPVKIANAGF